MKINEALVSPVNSALLTYENHMRDNSFLRKSPAAIESALREKGLSAAGVSANIPYNPYKEAQIALVCEDEWGEKMWCHMPTIMWLHLIWDKRPEHYPLRDA